MVDYYKILGISQSASAREIKSAYRRLARTRHPDVKGGTELAAREFAQLNQAYSVLKDPRARASYDAQLFKAVNGESVAYSTNPHAERLRRIAVQTRMNRVVDSFIEAERRENFMLQQAVFPTVALFLSMFFVGMFKPRIWQTSGVFGRALMLTLFIIGVGHLISRLRMCFQRFTYQPGPIHDSITCDVEETEKPFTRWSAAVYLVLGSVICLGAGLLIGEQIRYVILEFMPNFFDKSIRPELLFYPPIAVLIVDTMHAVASKLDRDM